MKKNNSIQVVLAFGSDIGDGEANIRQACKLLTAGGCRIERISSMIVTAPVDCVPGTPDFTNCCAVAYWNDTADKLLDLTQSIEIAMGRPENHSSHEARLIDIDILLFGELALDTPRLTIPHPRMWQREFVTMPLKELGILPPKP